MDALFDLPKMLSMSEEEAKKKRIGVAVSGGRDSVALLHMLFVCGYNVVAINVEHGIRGEESVADSRFVRELCDSMGIELYSYSVCAPRFSAENGYTLEQGARILRYRIFDELLDEGKCDYIALAHHMDDQAETVLMRILRGTGIRGLAGMRQVSGRYLRPLLCVSRADIDDYVKKNDLPFREDSSNGDAAYTRNFLRGEIAALKTRFPALLEAIARLSASAMEAEEYICAHTPDPVLKDGEMYVNISDLAEIAVAKRVILKAAEGLGVKQDIEERHFSLILSLANAESGKYIELTHMLAAHRQGDQIVFAIRGGAQDLSEAMFEEGDFPKFGIRIERVARADIPADLKCEKDALYLDADSVPEGAVIRHRKDGDVILKFGGGSKSLGDFFTDKKIPKRKRDGIAVIAKGSNVLAAASVDISSLCRITQDTREAFKITVMQ